MVALRAKKIANIAASYSEIVIEDDSEADILLIGWGSTYGSLQMAQSSLKNDGIAVAEP